MMAVVSLAFAPLSSFAATTQSNAVSKKTPAVKKPAVKKAAKKAPIKKKPVAKKAAPKKKTVASSKKLPATASLKIEGYLIEKNGATFALSTAKGMYTVQADAKTKFADEAGTATELKTILIPHVLEVSGTTSGKGKLHAKTVRIVPLKVGQGQLIGKVLIGPICPEQTADASKCSDQPYRALFTILKGSQPVAKTGSNEKGYFVLSLPEGEYTLHPEKPNDSEYPKAEDQPVTVKAGTFALATIKYDSGIR